MNYDNGRFSAGASADHTDYHLSDTCMYLARVSSKCARMAIMPILATEALLRQNKKIQ